MSIDLNWETLTTGPDGLALASSIRDFIHDKFQAVPLPRFIKSVTVHDFQFGSVPPELELKDITDPLPDFYEEPGSSDDDDDDVDEEEGEDEVPDGLRAAAERRRRAAGSGTGGMGGGMATATPPPGRIPNHPHPSHIHIPGLRSDIRSSSPAPSPFLGSSTPGIPGGTSNLHYFHSQFATGALSGTQTPLLAATGGHLFAGSDIHHSASSPEVAHQLDGSGQQGSTVGGRSHGRNASISSAISGLGPDEPSSFPSHLLRDKHSVSTLAPTSAGTSRPPTRDELSPIKQSVEDPLEDHQPRSKPRPSPATNEDLQAVFRIRYAGDVRLLLTADILLDYPMPSFVGIPLRLSITGLTFDGVGVLAKIRKRAHFCFLSPEDALAAVGGEENLAMGEGEGEEERKKEAAKAGEKGKMGGLLQEIRVESEIGQREGGKTSLKNVGKVERFVLEQVRRIFEEEFVYPSFWTFLI
jgi:distribution and morphology protein 12